jgi:hypothetical protein
VVGAVFISGCPRYISIKLVLTNNPLQEDKYRWYQFFHLSGIKAINPWLELAIGI